jgi:indolepyruvate decarboxylase
MSAPTSDVLATPDATVTVGAYLATRLRQLDGPHVFGLPGDFSLGLLDEMLAVPGIEWVGCTNELNATYAADAYARGRRGLAAVVTTYGVGELSAMNGIAGSYAEDVPVVLVSGMPPTKARAEGLLLHHTLVDGDHDHFVRAYREVTAAGTVLRAATAVGQIDRLLLTAINEGKPVYLGIPADVAVARVPAANLALPLRRSPSDPTSIQQFRAALVAMLAERASLTVLAGPRVHRRRLEGELAKLADLPGIRIATQAGAKALLDERHPASLGTYMGAMTRSAATRDAVDGAPLLVLAGTTLSDVLTGLFTHRFSPEDAVELGFENARIGASLFHGLHMDDSLRILHEVVAERAFPPLPPLPSEPRPGVPEAPDSDVLTQGQFWAEVQQWMPEGVTAIADAGTALFGALALHMPHNSDLLAQPVWSSIGYTLPATLGISLAVPEHRSVLFIGDGAAQLTIQELATILHGGHTPIIVLINNAGYTIERAIQSPHAVYQDITSWDWAGLPSVLAPGVPVLTTTVRTRDALAAALVQARECTDRLVLIEAVFDPSDAPELLVELGRGAARANGAPPPAG